MTDMLNSALKVISGALLIAAAAMFARHPYFAIDVSIAVGLLLLIEGLFGIVSWW